MSLAERTKFETLARLFVESATKYLESGEENEQLQVAIDCIKTGINMGHVSEKNYSILSQLYNDFEPVEIEEVQKDPTRAEQLKEKGNSFLNSGKYAEAIDVYNEALSFNSENPKIYFNKGMAYVGLKNNQLAEEDFLKAVSLDPTYAKAYYKLSQIYEGKNSFDKALEYANLALDNAPDNQTFKENLSRLENLKPEKKNENGFQMPDGFSNMVESLMQNPQARQLADQLMGGMNDQSKEGMMNMFQQFMNKKDPSSNS